MYLVKEELTFLVDRASSHGASYAEAVYHKNYGLRVVLLNGNPITISYDLSEGTRIRVLVNGALGFASTDSNDKKDLDDALNRAIKSARSSSKLVKRPIRLSHERLGKTSYSVNPRMDPRSVDDSSIVNMIIELYKSIDFEKYGISINSVTIIFNYSIEEKMIINSDGGMVNSSIPRLGVTYSITASYQGERANRWNQLGGSGGIELVDDLKVKEHFESDLNSLKIYLKEAGPSPNGKMDVVLGPEVVGLAMHESIGHPSEADRVMGREAAQAGLSYRRKIPRGEKIGSDIVTVIDDPTIPGSYGFYLYDDEAVPARPRYLIRNGVLDEYLHNRETAAEMGVTSNAAARAKEWWSEPIIRMANTYLEPGDYSLSELIEDINHGVYIKKYMEWNIDDYRWTARYVGFEAYEIKNGRISHPVKNPALEVNTKEFFSGIDAIGKDLQFFAGTCGKGEPAQGVPVWMGGPSIRLGEVMIK